MRWGKTPEVGTTRERVVYLYLPRRFWRRSTSFYFEDNGESIVLWLEEVYLVERWSYDERRTRYGGPAESTRCRWRVEAWRVCK